MKKIVLYMPFYALPIPSTMGGGVEELMTILLDENEKVKQPKYKFYFVTKKLYGKDKRYESNKQYKNSTIVKVKYNRFLNFVIRGFNRLLKLLKINKRFSNLYYNNSLKKIKSIKPDYVIFERDYDVNIKQFVEIFGKEKLAFHVHTQILDKDKQDISKYFSSIISVSNFISEDWKVFLGEKPIKYYPLLNCVNEERFNKQITATERKSIRSSFGFNDSDFVVLFCGRICEDKGIDKLIDAILSLDNNIKLLIVGSVNALKKEKSIFFNRILKTVTDNKDKIKTTGYVKNDTLYRIYQSADMQVVPSVWEEAAGLVVIEGQICGLPQIITKSGGMVEFANKTGTIIVPKDENLTVNLAVEINRLSKNKEKRKEFSKSNIAHGLEFNKQRYYREFEEILNKELDENAKKC